MSDDNRKEKLIKQVLFTERFFGADEIPKEQWLSTLRSFGIEEDSSGEGLGWEALESQAQACTQCRLCEKRTQVVFGEGNRNADILFIGEGPGYEEDLQGRPFVGKAGQLLTKIIEAMGLKREDVYIANCVKCRPPQNRNPQPDEVASCNAFLRGQIELIKPKVICALGKFAAQTLLQTDWPITRLRGEFGDYDGIKVMPTFHPAYLLRNPQDKKLVWQDVKKIMAELGLPLSKQK